MASVISFSLYGDNPLYCLGVIENVRLAPMAYPGWEVWVYAHELVDASITDTLVTFGARVIPVFENFRTERENMAKSAFWRFWALDEAGVERVLFRDADSRLSPREAGGVEEWIRSKRDFHLMYDHRFHTVPVMAGMWGAKYGALPPIRQLILAHFSETDSFLAEDRSSDQVFLSEVIFKNYIDPQNVIAHVSEEIRDYVAGLGIIAQPFPPHQPFYPSGRTPQRFVGETIATPFSKPKPARREVRGGQ